MRCVTNDITNNLIITIRFKHLYGPYLSAEMYNLLNPVHMVFYNVEFNFMFRVILIKDFYMQNINKEIRVIIRDISENIWTNEMTLIRNRVCNRLPNPIDEVDNSIAGHVHRLININIFI